MAESCKIVSLTALHFHSFRYLL